MGLLIGGLIEEIGDNCYAAASEGAWEGRQAQQQADTKYERVKEAEKNNKSMGSEMFGGVGQGFSKVRHDVIQDKQHQAKMAMKSGTEKRPWPSVLTHPDDMDNGGSEFEGGYER